MPYVPVPGQPHPDVVIIKNVFKELQPGQVIDYDMAAKAIGLTGRNPVFLRRATAARKILERSEEGGIVISCVPGAGFIRETAQQTIARNAEKTTKSISRKASRATKQVATVDVSGMNNVERSEVFGLAAQFAAIKLASTKKSRLKLTAASSVSANELAAQKAIEVLQERPANE